MPSPVAPRPLLPRLGALAACGALGLTSAVVLPAITAVGEMAEEASGTAPYFTRTATLPAYAAGAPGEAAVAEISAVTEDGRTVISTDSAAGRVAFTDISDPAQPRTLGAVAVDGEPTSVHAVGEHVLVVVDETDDLTQPAGHVSVLDASTREEVRRIELGGQPDSLDVTPDGARAFIAIENQRDEELAPAGGEEGDLPQAPTGRVAALELDGGVADWALSPVDLGTPEGAIVPEDLEPEYVTVSPDGTRVAVTLQENNAVVILDAVTGEVVSSFSAGTASAEGVDTIEDGDIRLDGSISDVPREPDAIAWVDDAHVATADEGDWKGGSRSWTVFEAATGEVTWTSGAQMDHIGVRIGQYPEGRSENKGTEPEGIAVATYDGRRLAFVGSERGNFVAVYDVTDPAQPVYQQALSSTPGPEGLLPVPERGLLIVSSEEDDAEAGVRATLQVYELGAETDADRTIVSDLDEAGRPLPWGTLSDLSAVPGEEDQLLAVGDSGYTTSALYRIDASEEPAVIRERLEVTLDGAPLEADLEGVTALEDGTAWLAAEGARDEDSGDWEIENALLHVDAQGGVLQSVPLPEAVADGLGGRGFEGVAVAEDGTALYAVIQGVAAGDPEGVARIARHDLEQGTWTYIGYQLAATEVDGDRIGLSAITDLGGGRFAVLERDSLNGPDAAIKQVVTIEMPDEGVAAGEELPMAEVVGEPYDLLPVLEQPHGWTQEKVESLAVLGSGELVIVTDNDALDDANGETLFARAGYVVDGVVQADPPREEPTDPPTEEPTDEPAEAPTTTPTDEPTEDPTGEPTDEPTGMPSTEPTRGPAVPSKTAAPPHPAPGADGPLARTGAQGIAASLGAAGLLCLLGGGALLLRRRTGR